ncbi:hypothetical protein ACFSSA_05825 [Luteolibacter algae]|uniref:Anti-sigma factor n=1 Tax=Luteolibacter algae TaxID=454151 RepID=A0ABW5D874_9BACT
MEHEKDWNSDDATWQLLGKAEPREASARFADDTLRALRQLPERDPWWNIFVKASPWVAVGACGVFAAMLFVSPAETKVSQPIVTTKVSQEDKWVVIEDAARVEMLSAAVDHMDKFSDQELVTLIGF